jgi:plastocyanin
VKLLAAAVLAAVSVTGAPPPARVQVGAQEFTFALSRTRVGPGPAIVELVNYGQDTHDLRLQRVGARHVAGTREVPPGDTAELPVTLAPGRYRLWCSIADHAARGMTAALSVR